MMKKILAALAAVVGGFFLWKKFRGNKEEAEDTEYMGTWGSPRSTVPAARRIVRGHLVDRNTTSLEFARVHSLI
jgi:hypothetical protein